jgi:hypothetical protein
MALQHGKDSMKSNERPGTARILGIGLDVQDRHIRITQGKNFDIFLGSERTHERLQETCTRLNEMLDRRGRRLEDPSRDEFVDMVAEAEGASA